MNNGTQIQEFAPGAYVNWAMGPQVITPSNGPKFKSNNDWWQGAVNYCSQKGMRLPTIAEAQQVSAYNWWGNNWYWTSGTDNIGAADVVRYSDAVKGCKDRNDLSVGVYCVIKE